MEPTPMAYFKGAFVPLSEAKVSVMTHALHYGTGVFEGIRGNWNADEGKIFIFRPEDHFARFLDGCKMLRMNLPIDAKSLVDLSVKLVEQCGYWEDIYIRPLAYKSAEVVANLKLHELDDDFTIFALPLGRYLETESVHCVTSGWRRIDETMIPPRVKISGLYVNSILAKTDAVLAGFDEALLLNQDGSVAEGTGENLFLVKNGGLVTPPLYSGILGGITRAALIELAKNEFGISTDERPIGRSELYLADELFLCGTAAHVTPVSHVDHRAIGSTSVGPVTKAIQELYFNVIRGLQPKYRHWCVEVTPPRLSPL
jgi:branched-chain amino acid aminotransferase